MKQVLVIDDDVDVRMLIREFLERDGYAVSDAPDGEAGLKLCRQVPFDLIIVDIFMPEKEGLETIKEIRLDYPNCKIIAISGGGSTKELSYLSLARSLGATNVLAKPFMREEILRVVKDTLRNKRS